MKKDSFLKKALCFAIVGAVALFTTVFALKITPAKAVRAEEISGKKLQYFKLEKPISVCRYDDKVYIAQNDKLIAYSDDTYRTLDLGKAFTGDENAEPFNVSAMDRCGGALLLLSDNVLYSVDMTSFTLSKTPVASDVSAFSVLGNEFIAGSINSMKIRFFRYQPAEERVFAEFVPDYVYNTINAERPDSLAFVENDPTNQTATYFFGKKNADGEDLGMVSDSSIASTRLKKSPESMQLANDLLYCRIKDGDTDRIITVSTDTYEQKKLLDLKENGLEKSRGFFVSGNRMLICDTENDRVIEFDISGDAVRTQFEISFTKIDLPENFGFYPDSTPRFIRVADETSLYNVNLAQSVKEGYFVFRGMYCAGSSSTTSEYLVTAEIGEDYYLISGKCTALVLKSEYTPTEVASETPEKRDYIFANDSTIYKTLYRTVDSSQEKNDPEAPLFASFFMNKGEPVKAEKLFKIRGVYFAYVTCEKGVGYIPFNCLTEKTAAPVERKYFRTATTARGTTVVYSDKELKTKTDELSAYSDVTVCSEEDGVCFITYGQDKSGYVKTSSLVKKGDFTKRIVAVSVLLALSICLTAIFFEKKFLYSQDEKQN